MEGPGKVCPVPSVPINVLTLERFFWACKEKLKMNKGNKTNLLYDINESMLVNNFSCDNLSPIGLPRAFGNKVVEACMEMVRILV
jgi:hypothetical protein